MKRSCVITLMLGALALAAAPDPAAALGGLKAMPVDTGVQSTVGDDGTVGIVRKIDKTADADTRSAVRFVLKAPVDLTGKALTFDLRGTSEADQVSVSAYNDQSRVPSLRGDLGRGGLDAKEWKSVLLQKDAARGLTYAVRGVDGKEPAAIKELVFIVSRKKPVPAGELKLEIRNLKVVPREEIASAVPAPAPVKAAEVAAPAPSLPVRNPFAALGKVVKVDMDRGVTYAADPAGVITVSGKVVRNDKSSGRVRIIFTLDKGIDLRGKALQFQFRSPDLADHLYIKLYNANAKMPSWAFYTYADPGRDNWETITLQRGFSIPLTWHTSWGDDSPLGDCNRFDFYVANMDSVKEGPINFQIRDLKIVDELKHIGNNLNQAAPLSRETVFAADGKSAEILHPATPAGENAARKLAAALKKSTGVDFAVRPGTAADRDFARPVIILGNVWNNPALLQAYARRATIVDERFPGPGGFVVDLLKEPIRRNVDALVIGASDDAGLDRAVDAAAAELAKYAKPGSLVTPLIFAADYAGRDVPNEPGAESLEAGLAEAQKTLDTGRHQSLAGEMARIGERYRRYRKPQDAKLFAAVAKMYADYSVKRDPRRYGGDWGYDSDFSALGAFAGLDLVEHDPALTDEERLAMVKVFQRWSHAVLRAKAQTYSWLVAHNHGTFSALGSTMAGLYFAKYYPEQPDGKWLLDAGKRIFDRQNQSGKVEDDCNGYQWLTWEHVMRYAAVTGDLTVIQNGVGRKMADTAIITMDNNRYQVPYGDTGLWSCYRADAIPMGIYANLTGDPAANWFVLEKMILWSADTRRFGGSDFGIFERRAVQQFPVPENYNGIQVLKLEPRYYATVPPAGGKPEAAETFDKLSFREKIDPEAFYLLTDGLNNGGHGHADAMSVQRLNHLGRQWLADNHYLKGATRFHNALTVITDGEYLPYGPYAKLAGYGENDRLGIASMRLDGPRFDWVRHYLWLKDGQALGVLDVVVPRADASALLRQLWNGVGTAAPQPDGVVLTQQGGKSMRLDTTSGSRITVTDDPDMGKNWEGYPYAEPMVRTIEFAADANLKKGVAKSIFSLFRGSSGEALEPVGIEELADGGVRFRYRGKSYRLTPQPDGTLVVSEGSESLTPRDGKLVAAASPAPAAAASRADRTGDNRSIAKPTATVPGPVLAFREVNHGGKKLFGAANPAGEIHLLNPDGTAVKVIKTPAAVNDFAAGDLDGDGSDELAVANQDQFVRVYKLDGTKLWEFQFPFYRIPPVARVAQIADIDGDGKKEVLIGTDSWRLHAFDPAGKLLWHYEIVREASVVEVADLNGDGKNEILTGTRYYHVNILTPDGLSTWKFSTNTPGTRALATFRNGKGNQRNFAVGGAGGELYIFAPNGDQLAEYSTGDELAALTVGPDENNGDTLYAGSLNEFCYRLNPDGSKRWTIRLDGGITSLLADGDKVYAGTTTGKVYAISRDGKILASQQLPARIAALRMIDGIPCAADVEGNLLKLQGN